MVYLLLTASCCIFALQSVLYYTCPWACPVVNLSLRATCGIFAPERVLWHSNHSNCLSFLPLGSQAIQTIVIARVSWLWRSKSHSDCLSFLAFPRYSDNGPCWSLIIKITWESLEIQTITMVWMTFRTKNSRKSNSCNGLNEFSTTKIKKIKQLKWFETFST